jgi:sterol desaturase/sphingolipid hydroxylase (fatty acid hydroxylase superfamily)
MSLMMQNLLVLTAMLGYAGMEFASHKYKETVHATADDTKLELLMFLSLLAITQPLAIFVTARLCGWLIPEEAGALASLPWWAMTAILLVADDMTQYWWHRISHSPLLWPLHRAHHSAQHMSARIVYRNNIFYYLAMPSIWISGILVYLGLGAVFLVFVVVKQCVVIGAHSDARWDEPLYKIKALRPLMWLVQRTISTPATHFAHHAMSNADGIGHYTGNFSNLLFLWDLLFGSAHITQQYPKHIGLIDDRKFGSEKWWVELLYPVFRSRRVHSALIPGGKPYDDPSTAAPAAR